MKNFWWYATDSDQLASDIKTAAEKYAEVQRKMNNRDKVHKRVYGVSGNSVTAGASKFYMSYINPVQLNVCRNIVDTLAAKIGKNLAGVEVTSLGANWEYHKRGKNISKYLNTKITSNEFAELAPQIVKDALIVGTGVVKTEVSEDNTVTLKRVHKEDVLVDAFEAYSGRVRQMVHKQRAHREELLFRYPEKENMINMCSPAGHSEYDVYDELSLEDIDTGHIDIQEAWHLPSGPGVGDGRHVIICQEGVLLDEEWEIDGFPLSFLHWDYPERGFWGTSLMETLLSYQFQIDETMLTIQEALKNGATWKVLVQRGSKIAKPSLAQNTPGMVIEYSGQVPIYQAPSPVSPQLLDHLNFLLERVYQQAALSELSAQSKAPPRLESSLAMQAFYDIESQRFSRQQNSYKYLFLDVSRAILQVSRKLYTELDSDDSVKWKDKSLTDVIDWDSVDMSADTYVLKLEATSMIPETRAGKLSAIQSLMQVGIVPQEMVAAHLEDPDLESLYADLTAAHNNVRWVVDQLEDEEVDPPEPDPMQDLNLGINKVKAAFNRAQCLGAPEEILERLSDWVVKADSVLNPPQPEAPQMPAAPPVTAGPQMAPAQPPAFGGNVPMPMPQQ